MGEAMSEEQQGVVESNAGDEQGAPPKRSAKRGAVAPATRGQADFMTTFGWAGRFFLSASAVAVALMLYGFFSESALLQFTGLPQLSADMYELAELGARAIMDSLASAKSYIVWFGALLGLGVLAWASRDRHPVGGVVLLPLALMLAQVSVGLVLVSLVGALVYTNTLSTSAGNRAYLAQAQAVVRAVRSHPDWSPLLEQEAIERLTYKVWPWWVCDGNVTGWFCGLDPVVDGPPDRWEMAAGRDSHSQRTAAVDKDQYGFPVRRTVAAQQRARDAFGLLFAITLFAFPLVITMRRWRSWLEDSAHIIPKYGCRAVKERLLLALRRERRNGSAALINRARLKRPWLAYFNASRNLVEPILVGLVLVSTALLPSAYGVLARGTVGYQQVIVRLKPQGEESLRMEAMRNANAGQGSTLEHSTLASGCGASSYALGSEMRAALVVPAGSDPNGDNPGNRGNTSAADAATEQAAARGQDSNDGPAPDDPNDDGGSDHGKGNGQLEPTGGSQPWGCDVEDLYRLDQAIDRYREHWRAVIQADDRELQSRLAVFEQSVQALFARVGEMGCTEAYRQLWLLAPTPDEAGAMPDLADAYWDSWRQHDRYSPVRFGYLLAYPRGSSSDILRIFTPLALNGRDHRIEAQIEEIPRECVAAIDLRSDERRRAVEETMDMLVANPNSDVVPQLWRYPTPHALDGLVSLAQAEYVAMPRKLLLITQIGTLLRVIASEHPSNHAALHVLIGMVDAGLPGQGPQDDKGGASDRGRRAGDASAGRVGQARAAASALRLSANPYAGVLVSRLLEERARSDGPTDWSAALGEVAGDLTTTAGFLANDLAKALRRDPPAASCLVESPGSDCDNTPVVALQRLDRFLGEVAASSTANHSQRLAACTALGLSGSSTALDQVRALVRQFAASPNPSWLLFETCLQRMPSVLNAQDRRLLRELARGRRYSSLDNASSAADPSMPDSLRTTALGELYEASLEAEDELIFELLWDPSRAVVERAALLAEDVDPTRLGNRLAECGLVEAPDARSIACLHALLLLDEREDGDSGLTQRVSGLITQWRERAQLAEDQAQADLIARATSTACEVMVEFRSRKGIEARLWLERNADCALQQMQAAASATRRERWEAHREAFLRLPHGSDSAAGEARIKSLDRAARAGQVAEFAAALESAGTDDEVVSTLTALFDVGAASAGIPAPIRVLAYEHLAGTIAERIHTQTVDLYINEIHSPRLVLASAQYLENGPFDTAAEALLNCAEDVQRPYPNRLRCVMGLPLLQEGQIGGPSFAARLQGLAARPPSPPPELDTAEQSQLWQRSVARAQAEYLARGLDLQIDGSVLELQPIAAEGEDVIRWLLHVQQLSEFLRGRIADFDADPAFEVQSIDEFISNTKDTLALYRALLQGEGS